MKPIMKNHSDIKTIVKKDKTGGFTIPRPPIVNKTGIEKLSYEQTKYAVNLINRQKALIDEVIKMAGEACDELDSFKLNHICMNILEKCQNFENNHPTK